MPVVPAAEMVIEHVAERAAATIDKVMESIAPDGRPFGMRKMSEREQLRHYMEEGLHDNPDAALNWIRTRVVELQKKIANLPPEIAQAVHPYDIVQRFAMVYSSRMETLLAEEQGKSIAQAEAPSISMELPEIDTSAEF